MRFKKKFKIQKIFQRIRNSFLGYPKKKFKNILT